MKQHYILACDTCESYTQLHTFDANKQAFDGEYSLLYNAYTHDHHFLNKFLIIHRNHQLHLLMNNDETYDYTLRNYQHFLWAQIDQYMMGKFYHDVDVNLEPLYVEFEQLQLSILHKLLEQELDEIRKQVARDSAEGMVLLGKELALSWAIYTLQDIIKRGQIHG